MPNYRVAVIGRTGRGNYGHGLDVVWRHINNVEIVAVADENEQGRLAAQKRLGAKNAYADFRTMLKKERPQIVCVADRHIDQHRDAVLACAEAGAHIFLEKPMCRTLAEADEMIAACEKHHVKVVMAHQTQPSPRLKRAKELIDAGRIGDILEMRSRGKEDHRGGGQDLIVHGTHLFSMMRYFAGDARWCLARIAVMDKQGVRPATRADVRDADEGIGPILGNHITAMFGFDHGVIGHHATRRDELPKGEQFRFGLTILGSKGIIQTTTGSLAPTCFLADPSWFPGRSRAAWQAITSAGLGKPETLKDGGLGQGNIWLVQDLIEAIEKDRQPISSMYDGRAALEMIMAVYESFRTSTTAELPLRNRRHPLTMLG